MKIKSLHIDGFGALVNYSLNINDELNSYFLNNGEGKTTIICFIKSMLFGLDKSNKKIDDRKLYFPKFASAFGGTLDIEIDNKIYHIRRTFDKKSVSKDVLQCTIDDKEINYAKDTVELLHKELKKLNKTSRNSVSDFAMYCNSIFYDTVVENNMK